MEWKIRYRNQNEIANTTDLLAFKYGVVEEYEKCYGYFIDEEK